MNDLSGKVFGRLTVIEIGKRDKKRRILWKCKCECGKETLTRTDLLTRGLSKSCGCLARELTSRRATKHSHCKNHRANGNSTYISWKSMRQRCYDPNSDQYYRYGELGIIVCERWRNSFKNFLEDMGERPEGTTIDRIKSSGNYELGNCRWANAITQNNNLKNNVYYKCNGQNQTLSQWARQINVSRNTLYSRIKNGWDICRTLNTPINSKYASKFKHEAF